MDNSKYVVVILATGTAYITNFVSNDDMDDCDENRVSIINMDDQTKYYKGQWYHLYEYNQLKEKKMRYYIIENNRVYQTDKISSREFKESDLGYLVIVDIDENKEYHNGQWFFICDWF